MKGIFDGLNCFVLGKKNFEKNVQVFEEILHMLYVITAFLYQLTYVLEQHRRV